MKCIKCGSRDVAERMDMYGQFKLCYDCGHMEYLDRPILTRMEQLEAHEAKIEREVVMDYYSGPNR